MDIKYRTIEASEYDRWIHAHEASFHGAPAQDEVELMREGTEFDRMLVALDGDQMVAGAAAASFKMTVPGGAKVPTAGVTGVGVAPTHRRRGVNTQLMRLQLDDFHERGEPLAILYASEGNIYGRFGYGLGVMEASIQIETIRAGFSGPHVNSGSVEMMEADAAMPVMHDIYEAATGLRPGMITADANWLRWRMTRIESDGPEPWFYAVHSRDGTPDGFAVYKVKQEWIDFTPRSEAIVRELHGLTPEATADLWRFVFDLDLIHTVKAERRPVDEPLLLQLAEPRRLRLTLYDGLLRSARRRCRGACRQVVLVRRTPGHRSRGCILSLEPGSLPTGVRGGVGHQYAYRPGARPFVRSARPGRRLPWRNYLEAAAIAACAVANIPRAP